MSFFTNRKVKVAANKRNKFNLSSRVMTTLNIGDTQPIFAREVLPSDKWNLDISSFTRLSPVAVPTFAQIKQVNRAFFVKYKDIWKNWEGFYTNTRVYIDGVLTFVQNAPYVRNNDIVNYLVNTKIKVANYRGDSILETPLFVVAEADSYEFQYGSTKFNSTEYGKRILNILNGLGIRLNFAPTDITKINILPILAYLKVYLDYYIPSRYYTDSNIRTILSFQTNDKYEANFGTILQELINCSYFYQDNDYFTSSWSTPNNFGNTALVGTSSIADSSADIINVNDNYLSSKAPAIKRIQSNTYTVLTAQSLNLLQSLYHWVTRKNLSGNKYFEQILTQFGIHIPYHDDMRSQYLGGSVAITEFGPVFNQSGSTLTSQLGAYAGRGEIKAKSNNINMISEDYGILIVLTSIVPECGYVQGRNREWLHIDRLDFFQPEFDCVGMQGVRKDELLTVESELDYKDVTVNTDTYSNKAGTIIGYQPRYNEYRRNIDLLNGDFMAPKTRNSLAGYHTFRLMNPEYPQVSTLNQYFRRSDSFAPSLNRMFQVASSENDHFICAYDVRAIAYRKMKSNSEAFELDGYDEVNVNNDNSLN